MTASENINRFLAETTSVSLGYSEINFFKPGNIDRKQIGYKIDAYSVSLVTENEGSWKNEWFVIATQQMGDSIFVNTSSEKLTVLSAAHGEGTWEAFIIADSLINFGIIIQMLLNVSRERTNPVELENNPIQKADIEKILASIESQNPETEMEYWATFFEYE